MRTGIEIETMINVNFWTINTNKRERKGETDVREEKEEEPGEEEDGIKKSHG